MRILVVEDDPELAAQLVKRLKAQDYAVDHSADGEEGHYLGETGSYAAAILDIGLPEMDGLDVLSAWRAAGLDLPVLLLTARDSWRDKVMGLRAGADDYLAKPFHTEELLARVEALLRRSGGGGDVLSIPGEVAIDLAGRAVTVAGRGVDLSAKEYRALTCLAVNRGKVVSKMDLGEQIYQEDADRDPNVIEVTIARLRKKIGADVIQTRRGHGYVID